MKAMLAAACILLASAGLASADPAKGEQQEEQSPYQIVDEDASIAFPDRAITGYRVGLDRSLILETVGHRFYRAELDRSCARDLQWEHRIGLRIPGGGGALRRSDFAIIDGQRCFLLSLDRIADPRPVEEAARAARREATEEPH